MYVVLVPVKPPAIGKSRLVGLSDGERRELAVAFALDTIEACSRASTVAAVLAVTDDARFAAQVRFLGCDAIPDGVAGDLNASLRQAAAEAARRWSGSVPVALCADLPAMQPAELDTVLAEVAQLSRRQAAYVADADGVGTTLYTAGHDVFRPRFGHGSAMLHQAAGARPMHANVPGLRRDVDDLDDLREALAIGVGPRTRRRAATLVGDGPS